MGTLQEARRFTSLPDSRGIFATEVIISNARFSYPGPVCMSLTAIFSYYPIRTEGNSPAERRNPDV